ncbi:MAG TPA: hypothetical protein VKE27_03480, partial [Candidatus Dormibacteraeota bacterium]|nr:hypothetical protein [Candidatus Dormibacteraeota bacterium]
MKAIGSGASGVLGRPDLFEQFRDVVETPVLDDNLTVEPIHRDRGEFDAPAGGGNPTKGTEVCS